MSKVPRRPPPQLQVATDDIISYGDVMWRIHRTSGAHILSWNSPRTYGPLAGMRSDPHPGPEPGPSDVGVLYCATDIDTALAEVYQLDRFIDMSSGSPRLTGWAPTRDLRLLDLTTTWALRNGAAYALTTAPRPVCRAWARAIYSAFPDLDGLFVHSTMTGASNIVLWDRARDAIPDDPDFSRDLRDSRLRTIIAAAADRINYLHH